MTLHPLFVDFIHEWPVISNTFRKGFPSRFGPDVQGMPCLVIVEFPVDFFFQSLLQMIQETT